MEMRLVVARSHGGWVMGGRTRLLKVSTGTPGGDGEDPSKTEADLFPDQNNKNNVSVQGKF